MRFPSCKLPWHPTATQRGGLQCNATPPLPLRPRREVLLPLHQPPAEGQYSKATSWVHPKNANSLIGFNPQEKEPLIIINCKQLMDQFYLHTSKIPPSVAEEIHGVERPQKRGYVRPKLSSDKDAKADAYCEEKERRENLQNISLLLRTYKMNSQAHQTSKSTRTRDDSDNSTGFLNYGVSSSSHSSNSISNPKMGITN